MRFACLTLALLATAGLASCSAQMNPSIEAGASDAGSTGSNSSNAGPADAGFADASSTDAGSVDAGMLDAGQDDAGFSDAGLEDAGFVDAGEVDASDVDAGEVDASDVDAGDVDAGPVATDEADAGSDDGGAAPDAGTNPDGGAGQDAGSVVTDVGKYCQDNSQCSSGMCIFVNTPIRACTESCSSDASCLPGWTCLTTTGPQEPYCRCTSSQEVCDGRDNDCNGKIDDGRGPDQSCVQRHGLGYKCDQGQCVCSFMCGSTCTDLTRDAKNCGACGQVCQAPTSSCNNGHCGCPGNGTLCDDSYCAFLYEDPSNCGSCGNACAAPTTTCSAGKCVCPNSQTLCNGTACVDLQTDPNNCGQCGVVCPSSGNAMPYCAAGSCYQLETLVSGYRPYRLAVDANNLYWLDASTVIPPSLGYNPDGSVMSIPLAGGSVTTLASGITGPLAMTIDSNNVYWTAWGPSAGTATVNSVPIVGGATVTIATNMDYPASIGVSATGVFWIETALGNLWGALGGAAPTLLASGLSHPDALVADSDGVYLADEGNFSAANPSMPGGILALPNGATMPTRLSSWGGTDWAIAQDALNVYWTTRSDPTGIWTVAKTGGSTTTLSMNGQAQALTVDDTNVYWIENLQLKTMPKSGGPVVTLRTIPLGAQFQWQVVADANSLYWIENSPTPQPGLYLMRLTPKHP